MRVKYIAEESWKGFERGKVYQADNLPQMNCWIVYGEKCKLFVRGSKWAVYVYDHRKFFEVLED